MWEDLGSAVVGGGGGCGGGVSSLRRGLERTPVRSTDKRTPEGIADPRTGVGLQTIADPVRIMSRSRPNGFRRTSGPDGTSTLGVRSATVGECRCSTDCVVQGTRCHHRTPMD